MCPLKTRGSNWLLSADGHLSTRLKNESILPKNRVTFHPIFSLQTRNWGRFASHLGCSFYYAQNATNENWLARERTHLLLTQNYAIIIWVEFLTFWSVCHCKRVSVKSDAATATLGVRWIYPEKYIRIELIEQRRWNLACPKQEKRWFHNDQLWWLTVKMKNSRRCSNVSKFRKLNPRNP